ncbi:hypothetical protein [Aeromicrobium chenweiae]|uniref:Uncharacterized protein n=1 Tax=Aeromicrobium chenweiae TaxID=2079793 RepID=A0A2S0WIS6_9ACTN|nr:hypothetical protein [Aeromicrobium chenweiae]AWB91192.1 hypothetical protein C3E78_02555 [Aeromicrobium chenweiae]TGN31710.1 hypothetical protein E4L97_12065 [Aeromicrobium chenweiae]
MPRLGSTLLSLALVGVITLAAYTDPWLLGVAVLLVQVLVAAAPGIRDASHASIPSPRVVPVVVASLVATVLTLEPDLLSGASGTSPGVVGASSTGMLSGILPAVAAAVFVALLAQMLRRDGRTHLVQSVGYAVMLSAVAALAAGWVGAVQSIDGPEVVAVAAAGVAGGLLAWALPIDRWVCLSLATLAGAGAGAAVAASVESSMTVYFGLIVGPAVALAAVLGQVVGRSIARGRTHASASWGFPGAMAVAFAGPIVYIGGQLLTMPNL